MEDPKVLPKAITAATALSGFHTIDVSISITMELEQLCLREVNRISYTQAAVGGQRNKCLTTCLHEEADAVAILRINHLSMVYHVNLLLRESLGRNHVPLTCIHSQRTKNVHCVLPMPLGFCFGIWHTC